MVVFNFNKVGENGNILGRYNLHNRLQRFYDIKEDENFNWRDIKPRILGGMHPASWNKFYKHELIKNTGCILPIAALQKITFLSSEPH